MAKRHPNYLRHARDAKKAAVRASRKKEQRRLKEFAARAATTIRASRVVVDTIDLDETRSVARRLGLRVSDVRRAPNGWMEITLEGDKSKLRKFLEIHGDEDAEIESSFAVRAASKGIVPGGKEVKSLLSDDHSTMLAVDDDPAFERRLVAGAKTRAGLRSRRTSSSARSGRK